MDIWTQISLWFWLLPDKTIHLTALYQLIHLLENEVNLNKIRMAENTEELVQLIEWESSLKI